MTELTIIKISATGRRDPDVPFGTPILLIQNGVVSVGRLMCEPDDNTSLYIDHPKNQEELDIEAEKKLRLKKPEYLDSKIALTVICPLDIATKMVW